MPSLKKVFSSSSSSTPPVARTTTTTSDAAPPSYATQAASGDLAPPSFSAFPSSYKIGYHVATPPLVTPLELKQHLVVLAAFHELKRAVQAPDLVIAGAGGGCSVEDKDARWSVFLCEAVERFERWIAMLATSESVVLGPAELPPLDVALVWHAYTLNPKWYQEDTMRVLTPLRRFDGLTSAYPLEQLAATIDPATFLPIPNPTQAAAWTAFTGSPFDPIVAFQQTQGRSILDPMTKQGVFVPYVTPDGKGYAQQGFEFTTSQGFRLTHEVLGVAKFTRDVVRAREQEGYFFAGTAFSARETSSVITATRATAVKTAFFKIKELATLDDVQMGQHFRWSLSGARAAIELSRQFRNPRVLSTIFSAYSQGSPFSLELTTAVLRQGTFIQKMVDLGWTRTGRFDEEDDTVLKRSVARYHAFLDLISSMPSTFCVPTLDIDLAWHSHQLNAFAYREDTMKFVGRFIDHDDKVEESALSTSYDVTARAWKVRFGVPYSICGCPLPDEPVTKKFASKIGLAKKEGPLAPGPLIGATGDDEDCDATHASEHNSVIIVDHPTAQKNRSKREKELLLRRTRDEKAVTKGKLSPETLQRQRDGHDAAFLYPMALYPYYGVWGYPGYVAGCAVGTGAYINSGACDGGAGMGGGACAAGVGGCAGGVAAVVEAEVAVVEEEEVSLPP
ncbi:hypothetical protein MNV49_007400 [Pseudohyphozyma bogoriensis]|nr:hypothetical protein MNV49_007400 [Pseudohyphozyma bogoriensis]